MKRLTGTLGMATIAVLVLIGGMSHTPRDGRVGLKSTAVFTAQKPRPAAGAGQMRDSCVPASPFDLPRERPSMC